MGILIIISGFLIDNTTQIPFVMRIVSPTYVKVNEVFEILDDNEKALVPISREGSMILLDWWKPQVSNELLRQLSFISRSTMKLEVPTGISSYDLRLAIGDKGEKYASQYIWNSNDAKQRLKEELDDSIFKWKVYIFSVGILITLLSGLWGILSKD